MTKNVFDIGIGTAVDTSGLEKGLSDVEKQVLRSAAEQLEIIENASREQIKAIQETEADKVALVRKGMEEQIAAVKANPGLDKAAIKAEIDAIRERENAKIMLIKASAKLEEQVIRDKSKDLVKQVQDSTKKQLQAIKDFSKKGVQALKEFAKGAGKELLGLDQVLAAVAGGPAAFGKLFVQAGKQIVTTLHEWSMKAAESASRQEVLNAVLKASGASAWTTASQLNKLAREQSAATGKTVNEITDMQSVLLGFRNVTGEVFEGATKAMIDMSAVMGGDLKGAANMLGKALDSPTHGMSALSRVGFVFTDQQKEMVKTLEESGRLEEAQAIVLGEVRQAFDGAASSTNATIKAQIGFNNAVTDFQTNIGKRMAPLFDAIKTSLAGLLGEMNSAMERQDRYTNSVSELDRMSANAKKAIAEQEAAIESLSLAGNQAALREIENRQNIINRIKEEDSARRKSGEEAAKNIKIIETTLFDLEKIQKRGKMIGDDFVKINEYSRRTLGKTVKDEGEAWQALSELLEQCNGLYEENQKKIEAIIGEQREKRIAEEESASLERERAAFAIEFDQLIKEQTDKIYKQAELLGLDINGQEVKKQILDAQLATYNSMLDAAGKLADGTYKYNEAVEATIKATRRSYEASKSYGDTWKKALDELIRKQKQLREELQKLLEGVVDKAKDQEEINRERRHQAKLLEVKKLGAAAVLREEERYRAERLVEEYQAEVELANKKKEAVLDANQKRYEEELKQARGSRTAIAKAQQEYEAANQEATQEAHNTIELLTAVHNGKLKNMRDDLEEALREADRETLRQRLQNAQEFLSIASSTFGNVFSAIKNNIDYELEENLRKNDAIIMSDEERAEKEEKLQKEAAKKRYKADMAAWAANVTMAFAQAALAVLQALAGATGPVQYVMAAMTAAMGAAQVAAVVTAQPKPPRFHEGGIVPGRPGSEVHTIQKAGEVDMTRNQFQDTMKAISNLADTKTGTGTTLQVNVENHTPAQVETQMDGDILRIVVREAVTDMMSRGELDRGFDGREIRQQGLAIT